MKKIPIRQITAAHQGASSSERFTIRRLQDIIGDNSLVQDLHRHDFFFLLVVQKGNGSHEIDFTNYKVADNSVFFLRPGQVHQLELKKGCTGYLVEFNNGFYHPKEKLSGQRLRKASNRNYYELDATRFSQINTTLGLMFQELTDREEGYQDVIKAYLDVLCIGFVRQSNNIKTEDIATNSYTQERFEEFLELLDKHITIHKQVVHYAGLMNLSPYQLNDITKSIVGKTASDLINEHIILEVKRYLLATPNQIKDIADLLGYEDVSYFIRFFKKHTGYSPEVFRHNFK
ncbi:helix-turn-helix transcriptional regulator [Chitinophaga sp. S165]|uniref:helix-turn-helix transcriptional regulator n=1 Tax=Chitinophaga sp. S165 TaxID=2135462 RepID=UPI000D7136A7|nr:helix-turn-helix transcriptional regulator [Chitinophaga sp. S165]